MKTEALALAAQQDAVRREDGHPVALTMNAEHERARLQSLADQHLADNRTLGALTDSLVDDLWPTDTDIVDAVVEAFNMDRSEVIDRLTKFDAAALRELEAA